MGGIDIVTLGCRLNAYESEVMRRHAEAAGLDDAVIVNSCAVTSEAVRQTRQAIRRARRDNPDARVVVTGCAAQIDPEAFAAMPEVDVVLGNAEKMDATRFAAIADAAPTPRVMVNDIMSVRETAGHLVAGFDGRSRAFVEVQQGCDHRCTFCIIPFGRGNNRSVPIGAVVDQVRTLTDSGYREIVLTGVDIASYGGDLPGRPRLGQMVRRLLTQVPALERLRLSSLDPAAMDDDLMRLVAEEPRLMPHLHLSIQAGDDMILKRMKRRHGRAGALALCQRLHALRPGIALGADLIAGFPTETEAMFRNTLDFVEEAGLTWLHVFPYSPRPGTPAARMPQVAPPVRRERAALLRDAGEVRLDAFLATRHGATVRVLVETGETGRCEHYATVRLDRAAAPGDVVAARVTGHADGTLDARLAA